jgi:aminoglycoside/choline kinase family phosphotransferase
MSRDPELEKWLFEHVTPRYPGAIDIAPASTDASFRRYFRLSLPGNETRILMDAPPDKEDSHPFVYVAALLHAAGIRAPVIEIADLEHGFLLLSDLGSLGYLAALKAAPEQADCLMRPVLDVLVRWQCASRPGILPAYDEALLRREMALFPEWYVARHLGKTLDARQQKTLDAIFSQLVTAALAQPKVFVHRDFMPRNLVLRRAIFPPGPADGNANAVDQDDVGVLDFQDAVFGPITYDVVSLFRDAFISWEEEQELDWVVRYWEKARAAGLPVHADFAEFWRAYEWMGLQRHLKVLGIFCRLKYRDKKTRYIAELPRFLDYALKTARRYRDLNPLVDLLEALRETPAADVGYTF